MSMAPSMTVVVLSYRNEATILPAVESLLAQNEPVEIVVSHSGGGHTPTLLERHRPFVRFVGTEARRLPGAARNAGIAVAQAPYVAFLEGDCLALPGWVAGRLARHRNGAGAVACALAPSSTSVASIASHLLQHSERMPHLAPRPEYRFGASYSQELLERCGPFPENLRFAEDVAMNVRVLSAGGDIAWAPEVVTAHAYPDSARGMLRDQFKRGRMRASTPHDLLWRAELVARALANAPAGAWRASLRGSPLRRADVARALPLLVPGAIAKAAGVIAGAPATNAAALEHEFHRWLRHPTRRVPPAGSGQSAEPGSHPAFADGGQVP